MKRLGLCGAVWRLLHSHSPPQPPPMPPRRHPGGWGAPEAVIFECATVFWRMGVLLGLARTDHDRRALLRQHEDRDTPLWLPLPTCTTNNTLPPNNHADLSPSTHRSHRRVHVGRRALRAAVCGVWRSFAHTNTQLAPPRWINMRPVPSQCEWVGVDVCGCGCVGDGAAARRPGADETRPCDRKAGSAE